MRSSLPDAEREHGAALAELSWKNCYRKPAGLIGPTANADAVIARGWKNLGERRIRFDHGKFLQKQAGILRVTFEGGFFHRPEAKE